MSIKQCYDYSSLSLEEEMPMENIKQQFSDLVRDWTIIMVTTLFLFSGSPANALTVEPLVKTEAQLKQEVLDSFSKEIYKPSEMLTDQELVKLLLTVGFEGVGLKKAWSIAKRESNGRPLAYNGNRNTGDSSYGLFQINMIGNLGPTRLEKFNLKSNKELFDPVTNAEITYYMTNGGSDWSAWKGMTQRAKEFYLKFPTK
jgi:hypothetical protein